MNTIRHNLTLKWRDKLVIAPRTFSTEHYTYFVHICDFDCTYVEVFLQWGELVDTDNANVILHNFLKLYSNKKGLYFNFTYYYNSFDKKTIRVYLCE